MTRNTFTKIKELINKGEPVGIKFFDDQDESDIIDSDKLFCEHIINARYGESVNIKSQRCYVGEYILGKDVDVPYDYYLKSGRYKNKDVALSAASSLPRLERDFSSILIAPISMFADGLDFDVMILYLTPEKAMKVVQAYAYHTGQRSKIDTIGAGSICSDCTIIPLISGLAISMGCKGSRKHTKYDEHELPVGMSLDVANIVESGLAKIPDTHD